MAKSSNHRTSLLDSAQQLMLAKGFPATRVDEICVAAGVTKGSFYHHFESKDALAIALVEHYFSGLEDAIAAVDGDSDEDPRAHLLGFLDQMVAMAEGPFLRRGCLLGSFALDLSETHPELRVLLDGRLEGIAVGLEALIREAHPQASPDPNDPCAPSSLPCCKGPSCWPKPQVITAVCPRPCAATAPRSQRCSPSDGISPGLDP